MKVAASIILILLGFLAVSPIIKQMGKMDGCCDVACTDTEKEKKPASDSCPFGICCCNYCMCCYSAPSTFKFRDVFTGTEKNWQANEKVLSNYLSDCWHPPKVV